MINSLSPSNNFYAKFPLPDDVVYEINDIIKDLNQSSSQLFPYKKNIYQVKNTPIIKKYIDKKIIDIDDQTGYGNYVSLKLQSQLANFITKVKYKVNDVLVGVNINSNVIFNEGGVYSWVIDSNYIFIFPSDSTSKIFPFNDSSQKNIIMGVVKLILL